MWMQQSMESASINSQGNFHNRNRFASSGSANNMYGRSIGSNDTNSGSDWKSKIMEGGQWLGGKVIAYGGKLARGGSHDTIPDHMTPHVPRNDGRANWMADIRNSSSSFTNTGSYSNMSGNTYQNDFVTERPQAYSDYASNNVPSSTSTSSNAPRPYTDNDVLSSRRVKKKSDKKKHDKKTKHKSSKKKKSKRRTSSSSDDSSASESDLSPADDSDLSQSETDSEDHRQSKSNQKSHTKKRRDSISSESDDDLQFSKPSKNVHHEKASADYSFSFDPAKLPPPPAEIAKKSKSSKKVSVKSSRGRRQSMDSTDSEASDKENQSSHSRVKKSVRMKAKNTGHKKMNDASVDLLGVDLDAMTVTSTSASVSEPTSQQLHPMQALAGLNFEASYNAPPTTPSAFAVTQSVDASDPTQGQQQVQKVPASAPGTEFITNLLPKNDIVDLNTLASTVNKNEKTTVTEKLSLNEMQRQQPQQQQQPHMPVTGMGSMYPNMMPQQQQYSMMQQQGGIALSPIQMQQMQMQMQHMNMMRQQQAMQYPSNQHMFYTTPYQQNMQQQQQFSNGGAPYSQNQYPHQS